MNGYFYCLRGEKIFFSECKTSKPKNCKLALKEVSKFVEYNGISANHGINQDSKGNPFVVLLARDDMYAKGLLWKYYQDKMDEKHLELDDLLSKQHAVLMFEMEEF